MEEVIPQRKSFVPIQEEMQIGGEADQSGSDATSQRRTSHWLGAELVRSQDRSGGRSLRGSSPNHGCSANGRRRRNRRI
jgi:hypothetical protein